MSSKYQIALAQYQRYLQLKTIEADLSWDEAVMMPTLGAEQRTRSMSLLASLTHEVLADETLIDVLDSCQDDSLTKHQSRNLQLMQRHHLTHYLPDQSLAIKITEANQACEQIWRRCRAENDWQSLLPHLEKVVDLQRQKADLLSQKTGSNPYDCLIGMFCPDLTQTQIDPLFNQLKSTLPELIRSRQSSTTQRIDLPALTVDDQQRLALTITRTMGLEPDSFRLDSSHHPFSTGTLSDVRITTRYQADYPLSSLTGVFHEVGHALYEQQLPYCATDQCINRSYGMVIHESQSLLMEKMICSSMPFLNFLAQQVKQQTGIECDATELHAALSQVKPGMIRVDADTACYPLHLIIRYELEQALFNNTIEVADLPSLWKQKMQMYLNVKVDRERNGVMQDVHWYAGLFGYFPAYALGLVLAAQLYNKMQKQLPDMNQRLEQGDFSTINAWLKQHIHQKASSESFDQIVLQATGETLNIDAYLRFIERRS